METDIPTPENPFSAYTKQSLELLTKKKRGNFQERWEGSGREGGGSGSMLPQKILKKKSVPFEAFWRQI